MKKYFAIACLAMSVMAAQAATPKETADALAKLNAASAKFTTATAEFNWTVEQKLPVPDTTVQKGSIAFKRSGSNMEMAAHIVTSNGQPAPEDLVYVQPNLQMYEPKINKLTIISAGSNRGMYESFLTLGFGGSGTELQQNWNVTLEGYDKIDGVDTARFNLVSKLESVRNNFTHVTLWVDLARGVSLKQIFFQKDGSTRTVLYSKIAVGAKLGSSTFTVKTAKNPSKEYVTR